MAQREGFDLTLIFENLCFLATYEYRGFFDFRPACPFRPVCPVEPVSAILAPGSKTTLASQPVFLPLPNHTDPHKQNGCCEWKSTSTHSLEGGFHSSRNQALETSIALWEISGVDLGKL